MDMLLANKDLDKGQYAELEDLMGMYLDKKVEDMVVDMAVALK